MNSFDSKRLRKIDSAPPQMFSFSKPFGLSDADLKDRSSRKVFTPRTLQSARVKGLKSAQSTGFAPRRSLGSLSTPPKHVSLYKTEICRAFLRDGNCPFDDKCDFAHGQSELRSVSRHPKYKTRPCKLFTETGVCPYGSRCSFLHEQEGTSSSSSSSSASQGKQLYWSQSDIPLKAFESARAYSVDSIDEENERDLAVGMDMVLSSLRQLEL